MKKKKNVFSMGFLGKFTLIVALFVGGGMSASADTVIFDSSTGNNITSGWTLSGFSYYYSTPRVLFVNNSGTITSDSKITLSSGDSFIIEAKGRYSGDASITIKYSLNGTDWTEDKSFSTSTSTLASNTGDFSELVVNDIAGSYYLQIAGANVSINIIKIVEASVVTQPKLSISTTSIALGVKTSTSNDNSFTVTNSGVGSMNVSITSEDAGNNFSVSPISFSLNEGEEQEVVVTFSIGGEGYEYGDKNATFVVTATDATTPSTGWAGDTKDITITGTSKDPNSSDLILDENDVTSSVVAISGKTVLFKYTPSQDGWNTLITPFQPKSYSMNYLDAIFGSGWKAYTIKSYSNGVITFENQTGTISANVPLLIYKENPISNPNGVLLEGVYIYSSALTAGKNTQGNATFQGTYVIKNYQDGDNWYGLTSTGQVMKAKTGAKVLGYRAYFTGINPPTTEARPTIVLVGDDDLTDIGFVKMIDEDATDVYTLSGQKVQKAAKGIYIVNGRKVIIK